MAEPRLQSQLGIVAKNSNSKDRTWANGYLALGKVLKVHHKRYTADVQIYGSSDIITSAESQEGKHSCRIGVNNAGYDTYFKKPYGEIIPIQEGSIVLVAFLKNTKEKPVIIRVFHDISESNDSSNYKNILNNTYLQKVSEEEKKRYTKITPIQDFFTVDGLGNFELSSHTKSFLVGINKKEIDEENFDYEDLSVSNADQTTIGVGESNSTPMKFLALFRDNWSDSVSNWLRIIVDPLKTVFKVAKQQRQLNKLSIFEITQNGDIRMRRQQDTVSFDGSSNYTEVSISSDGDAQITVVGESTSTIKISKTGGVSIETNSSMELTSDEDIKIKAKTVDIEGSVKISEDSYINNKRIAVQEDSI